MKDDSENCSEVARQSSQQNLDKLTKLDPMNELLKDSQLTNEDVDELAALVNEGAFKRLRENHGRDSEFDLAEDA